MGAILVPISPHSWICRLHMEDSLTLFLFEAAIMSQNQNPSRSCLLTLAHFHLVREKNVNLMTTRSSLRNQGARKQSVQLDHTSVNREVVRSSPDTVPGAYAGALVWNARTPDRWLGSTSPVPSSTLLYILTTPFCFHVRLWYFENQFSHQVLCLFWYCSGFTVIILFTFFCFLQCDISIR